ncbi:hypothetical protein SGPA1_41084 [Streptomyces misionensis JCM 4497]
MIGALGPTRGRAAPRSRPDQGPRPFAHLREADPRTPGAGATEEKLHPVVAEAITESYFTEWGNRAAALRAYCAHVSKIEFRF